MARKKRGPLSPKHRKAISRALKKRFGNKSKSKSKRNRRIAGAAVGAGLAASAGGALYLRNKKKNKEKETEPKKNPESLNLPPAPKTKPEASNKPAPRSILIEGDNPQPQVLTKKQRTQERKKAKSEHIKRRREMLSDSRSDLGKAASMQQDSISASNDAKRDYKESKARAGDYGRRYQAAKPRSRGGLAAMRNKYQKQAKAAGASKKTIREMRKQDAAKLKAEVDKARKLGLYKKQLENLIQFSQLRKNTMALYNDYSQVPGIVEFAMNTGYIDGSDLIQFKRKRKPMAAAVKKKISMALKGKGRGGKGKKKSKRGRNLALGAAGAAALYGANSARRAGKNRRIAMGSMEPGMMDNPQAQREANNAMARGFTTGGVVGRDIQNVKQGVGRATSAVKNRFGPKEKQLELDLGI